jgi:murein L,D-transpeptidase YafK
MGIAHPTGSAALRACAHYVRAVTAVAGLAGAIALAGCETDGTDFAARALKPLSAAMVAELERKNMPKESPILVRSFKEESEFEIWKQDATGRFGLLKAYPICRWSGELGPKVKEGDRQAPEGFYTITPAQLNPNSHYYLSFDIGYPNAFDRANGRTGSNLMVHGDCSSRGCYAMTDEQITEIYALARESFFGGQRSFQVQAYPFRMTPANLARHRNNPNMAFWKMLKEGNDHFEISRLEPTVNVCEKHYVFDAEAPGTGKLSSPKATSVAATPIGLNFNPTGRCPALEVPRELAAAVAEKAHRDDQEFAELVNRGTPTVPIVTGADGGMNPVFASKYQTQVVRQTDGSVRTVVEPRSPGNFFINFANFGGTREASTPTASEPPTGTTVAPTAKGSSAPGASEQKQAAVTGASGEAPRESGSLFSRLLHWGGRDTKPDPQTSATPSSPPPVGTPQKRPPAASGSTALAARQPPKPAPPPAPDPARHTQEAQPAAAPSGPVVTAPTQVSTTSTIEHNTSLLTADPASPAGTFEGRWSGVR